MRRFPLLVLLLGCDVKSPATPGDPLSPTAAPAPAPAGSCEQGHWRGPATSYLTNTNACPPLAWYVSRDAAPNCMFGCACIREMVGATVTEIETCGTAWKSTCEVTYDADSGAGLCTIEIGDLTCRYDVEVYRSGGN